MALLSFSLALVATFWGDSNKTVIVNGTMSAVFMGCGAGFVLTGSPMTGFARYLRRVLSEVLVLAVIELPDLQVAYLGT